MLLVAGDRFDLADALFAGVPRETSILAAAGFLGSDVRSAGAADALREIAPIAAGIADDRSRRRVGSSQCKAY
jgi:hypothetical protein